MVPPLSTKVLPHTLPSISSVTRVEPLVTTTVLSVPGAILARLIVWEFIVSISLELSPITTLPSTVNVLKALIGPDTNKVPSRSILSLKSIVLPAVLEKKESAYTPPYALRSPVGVIVTPEEL